jgi:hypothetical protein
LEKILREKEEKMSKLKVALDLVPEKVEGLIKDYREQLEAAWLKKEDTDDLTVSFSVKFSIEQGKNTCNVTMSFTPEKITDKQKFTWDDKQLPLPIKPKKK